MKTEARPVRLESERERRFRELCTREWRRHLVESNERRAMSNEEAKAG